MALPLRPGDYGGGLGGALALAAIAPLKAICAAGSLLLSRLDLRHKVTERGHCKNYVCIARPSAVSAQAA